MGVVSGYSRIFAMLDGWGRQGAVVARAIEAAVEHDADIVFGCVLDLSSFQAGPIDPLTLSSFVKQRVLNEVRSVIESENCFDNDFRIVAEVYPYFSGVASLPCICSSSARPPDLIVFSTRLLADEECSSARIFLEHLARESRGDLLILRE